MMSPGDGTRGRPSARALRWVRCAGAIAIVASLNLVSCAGIGEKKGESDHGGCSASVHEDRAVELRYRVESGPTSSASFRQTISALCARFARLGLRDVGVGQAGHDLVVHAPRRRQAGVRAAVKPGKLGIYDWDPNVVGQAGPDIPFSGRTALFDAVEAAARMQPREEATDLAPGVPPSPDGPDRQNDSGAGARFYLFGADRQLIAGPASSPSALATAPGRTTPGTQMVKVPEGIAVVEAERSPKQSENVKRYFVLEDDVEVSGSDIERPRPARDPVTREPILKLSFSEKGRVAFAALTRRIAERGAGGVPPPGSVSDAALQRVAIVLDDRLVSLAAIDFRENPEGIDGRTGAQIGGIGTAGEVCRLALLLRARPLPAHLAPLTPES